VFKVVLWIEKVCKCSKPVNTKISVLKYIVALICNKL